MQNESACCPAKCIERTKRLSKLRKQTVANGHPDFNLHEDTVGRTMSTPVNKLVTSLAQNLRPDGFSKLSSHILVRQAHDHLDLILLGSRKDAASGVEMCSFNVGICFPLIESTLNPDEEATRSPTIGSPIHLLTKERTFREWSLSALSLEATEAEMRLVIKQVALTFFESFGTIEAVVERLSQENAAEWFTMTPVRRVEVLASSLFALHRKPEAVSLLENEIEKSREKLPKYRLPLQRLLQRLTHSDSPPSNPA